MLRCLRRSWPANAMTRAGIDLGVVVYVVLALLASLDRLTGGDSSSSSSDRESTCTSLINQKKPQVHRSPPCRALGLS